MTRKQELFIKEYLIDLNATQAAIRAGYSERTAHDSGCELLKKPNIRAIIDQAIEERAKRLAVSSDQVISELKHVAFARMGRLARWNASGVEYKASEDLSDGDLASVQAIEEVTNQHGGTLKIKQHDKIRALELLGKHLGMFKDTTEVSVQLERPLKDMSNEELQKLFGNAP